MHLGVAFFDGVPDVGFDADPVEAVDLLDAGRRGHVDLGHEAADHVDADEDEAALGERRADGVYVSPRLDHDKQCILVIIGADEYGRKELRAIAEGYRESAQSWREVLLDLKRRGLTIAPELAAGDGALGFWEALREVYGTTREQRCWVHKTERNLNNKISRGGFSVVFLIQCLAAAVCHTVRISED